MLPLFAGAPIVAPLYSAPMSAAKNTGKDDAADLEDLARRFQDLWRDQMAATATDPEFIEMMGKWMAAFAPGGGPATGMQPGMFPGMPAGMPSGMPTGPGGPIDPAGWMAAMQAAMAGAARKGGMDDGKTGAATAGATAAAATSRAGNVAGDGFERRLAALEQRMDRLEAALDGQSGGAAKGSRRRKP